MSSLIKILVFSYLVYYYCLSPFYCIYHQGFYICDLNTVKISTSFSIELTHVYNLVKISTEYMLSEIDLKLKLTRVKLKVLSPLQNPKWEQELKSQIN